MQATKQKRSISERLADGVKWLDAAWEKGAPDPGTRFKRAVDSWADLHDQFYREGGSGCALGLAGPCAPGGFIQCVECLRKAAAQ